MKIETFIEFLIWYIFILIFYLVIHFLCRLPLLFILTVRIQRDLSSSSWLTETKQILQIFVARERESPKHDNKVVLDA